MTQRDSTNDESYDPEELDEAVNDTAPTGNAPEVDQMTASLSAWDEAPGSSGKEAPKVPLEDETAAPIKLVNEGLDIADSEQRAAAADPDSEG